MSIAAAKQATHHTWDRIAPETLLQLVSVRKTTDRFGKLLRHYWLPSTILTYESTVRQNLPQSRHIAKRERISKRQVHCDADSCTWRQCSDAEREPGFIEFSPTPQREQFCIYNRSQQSFRAQPLLGHAPSPEQIEAARIQAFVHVPVLTPLLPIPVGFQWYVEAEGGYIEFTLESEMVVGDMPVIIVRRHGEFALDTYYQSGKSHSASLKLRREGITAYAADRSVVLQDRTHDVVIESYEPTLLGLETVTVSNLVRSKMPDREQVAPIQFQYETDSKRKYLYDNGTGRLIRVNIPGFDHIVNDYQKLHPLEIYQKHTDIDVTKSLCEIEKHRGEGLLGDHSPDELCHVDKIIYERELHDVGEFWQSTASLLVLGITEKCNLNCSYCCFSGKFAGQRTHSHRSMSFDVARKAIVDYLDQQNTNVADYYPISFYGGEPLLERQLLIDCVEFAKEYAAAQDKKVLFAITTNGTLLDDTIVDFLVENHFLVLISLDGPQFAHDRYRVFPDGKGSFETIDANLKRFAQRHPGYPKRGLNFTLAPPFDFAEMERFVEEVITDFPLSRIALVNPGIMLTENTTPQTQYGCRPTCCSRSESVLESFRNFRKEDYETLKKLWEECVENLATLGSVEARKQKPFSTFLFEGQLETYHKRAVQNKKSLCQMFVPCMPGFTRRFCDVEGNYRVCERVDDSHAFRLGNVWTGLATEKLEHALELRRHFGDCANCTSIKTCGLCYARIPNSDAAKDGFDPTFDLLCQNIRETDRGMFKTYTEIMERNPKAFERPSSAYANESKMMLYATQSNLLNETVIEKLRCEEQR